MLMEPNSLQPHKSARRRTLGIGTLKSQPCHINRMVCNTVADTIGLLSSVDRTKNTVAACVEQVIAGIE